MIKITQDKKQTLSRRTFLIGSISTGLMMGFSSAFAAVSSNGKAQSAQQQIEKRLFSPSVWFEMSPSGATVINIAKAEMGQHIGTALARVVAEELGVDWAEVSLLYVDTDPKWGYMTTGGSTSVFETFNQLSQAGVAGRVTLIEAGAKLLGVSKDNCTAEKSVVRSGNKSISYAKIIQKGDISRRFTQKELDDLPLKAAQDRRLLGKKSTALDVPAKTTGTAVYGIDVERPDMVFGRPIIPPTRYGSRVKSVDDSAAKKIPEYLRFVKISDPSNTLQGWVVAVAKSYWGAVKAANAIKVDWDAGSTAKVTEKDILDKGRELAKRKAKGTLVVDDGDTKAARKKAGKVINETYTTSTVLHFTMEPANAVAEEVDGKWHIHTGNQWQSLILPVVAKALQVPVDDVTIHQYYLGGGFGRRLYGDYVLPAALASKAIGKPVKIVFVREDDSRFDCPRSISVQQLEASIDTNGHLSGIEHTAVDGWPTLAMAPEFLNNGLKNSGKFDQYVIFGANHWYTLANHRIMTIVNELAQRTFLPGYLRSVGGGLTGWGVESFMDELAVAMGKDPVEFRLQMLDATGKNAGKAPESVGGALRLAAVLKRVQKKAGWGKSLPKGKGQGVAVSSGQDRAMPTWVACVAEVSGNSTTGEISVEKLTMVIDCGTTIHPDGALAQAEGAALWGVSLALHEATTFEKGQVKDHNLDTYTPLRMPDVPELDIEFVESKETPVGLGEPPVTVVAPAIANAIYAAVGARVRHLPIKPADVIKALS